MLTKLKKIYVFRFEYWFSCNEFLSELWIARNRLQGVKDLGQDKSGTDLSNSDFVIANSLNLMIIKKVERSPDIFENRSVENLLTIVVYFNTWGLIF